MYQLDQTPLPNWTTPLDAVDLFWQHDSSFSQASHLPVKVSPSASLQTSSRPADSRWPESIATRDGEQTQVGSTAQPDHMWEPIPSAPSDFREEVLNLFSTSEAPQLEPAKHESAQSAPAPSGLTAASEKSGNIHRDVSALSRTRSQPHTSEQKQANARESQKRFRMRQKV